MKSNLHLLSFNNYYNRIIKKFDTLSEYPDPIKSFYNVNFNPADGVDTKTPALALDADYHPDYLIETSSWDGSIISRWFIIDEQRTAGGQWVYSLHRDVIADNYEDILTAPTFIEKATISDMEDPAIYNNENLSFNQIKTSETLIKDSTKIGWIVGYIPRDHELENTTISIPTSAVADLEVDGISNWTYYNILDTKQYYKYLWEGQLLTVTNPNINFNIKTTSFNNSGIIGHTTTVSDTFPSGGLLNADPERVLKPILTIHLNDLESRLASYLETYSASNETLIQQNGKVIFDTSTGLYWQVKVNYTVEPQIIVTDNSSDINTFLSTRVNLNTTSSSFVPGKTIKIIMGAEAYTLSLEQVIYNVNVDFASVAERPHLTNAPYDMFCIPYGRIQVKTGALTSFYSSATPALQIGQQIAATIGDKAVYDVQLLPYCPCRHLLELAVGQDILNVTNDPSKSIITDNNNNPVSVLIWCTTNEINTSITGLISPGTTALERKVINETETYRLSSPNYNGIFEFNPAKNKGVYEWVVNCTYKPFNPYIKVAPRFGGLYGTDFGDARGLICGGDFSLSRVSEAWANYELNNKNYQAAFDRQIENLELKNDIQRIEQLANVATGAIGAGATAGLLAGNISPAMGGGLGIGAGLASAAGGVVDYMIGERLREETLDYTKDQFGYNLQNIQALPQSLSKVSAFNANNKIFPFVERYTCTDIERQALLDKLTYNGMTVMRIGNIASFLQEEKSYIKGRLIRLEGVGDYHMVNVISEELNRGVYI